MTTTTLGKSGGLSPERARRIGATDVTRILGISPFGCALDVWARIRGEAEPFEGNAYTLWGLATEQMHAELLNQGELYRVVRSPGFVVHPDHDWLCASPDGEAESLVLTRDSIGTWEAKAPIWDVWEDGVPPPHYLLQAQVQMLVTGSTWGIASRLTPPKKSTDEIVEVWELDADRELHARLIEQLSSWWQRHIVEGRVPVDGATLESVRAIWPDPLETATRISSEATRCWAEQEAIGEKIRTLESERDALRGRIAVEIGAHSYGVGQDIVISHKQTTRKSYVVKESTYRTLRAAKTLPAGIPIIPNSVQASA